MFVKFYLFFFNKKANLFLLDFTTSMKISRNANNVNFEAIKLTRPEAKRVGQIMRQYKSNSNQELQQILDIFTPHIEKEVASTAKKQDNLSIQDYTQKLYLKLFEGLERHHNKHHPTGRLVDDLNEVKPEPDDFLTMGHKSFNDLTPEEEFAIRETNDPSLYHKMREAIISTDQFTPRYQKIALSYLDGYSYNEIGEEVYLKKDRVQQIISTVASRIDLINKKGSKNFLFVDSTGNVRLGCKHKGYFDEIMEPEGY